jgi:hypothetical protein
VSTGTQQRPDTDYRLDHGDAERFAHIIHRPGGNAAAAVTEAQVLGTPVEALCGKKWVPSRDPKRFPLCPACKEIAIERGMLRP